MELFPTLFEILNVHSPSQLKSLSLETGISIDRFKYLNDGRKLPDDDEARRVTKATGVTHLELKLRAGMLDIDSLKALSENASDIARIAARGTAPHSKSEIRQPTFETALGKLFGIDCKVLMSSMESNSVDMVFADPPFNLNKVYPSNMNDSLRDEEYATWQEQWVSECIRVLKPGGSMFIWNLPKWNAALTGFLNNRLTFKNWIAVDMKYSLPISGRLYPSHYSLLYYTKGPRANVFKPDRLPMETCPKCYGDLKDYGGYKDKMNPAGVNMSDVWYDIPPVRHSKYKRRNGANELSIKLLDRVIEMSTNPGDLVFDPFGGAGTTYAVAEVKKRRWIGTEIGPLDEIIQRLNDIETEAGFINEFRENLNRLFPARIYRKRIETGWWVHDNLPHKKAPRQSIMAP